MAFAAARIKCDAPNRRVQTRTFTQDVEVAVDIPEGRIRYGKPVPVTVGQLWPRPAT